MTHLHVQKCRRYVYHTNNMPGLLGINEPCAHLHIKSHWLYLFLSFFPFFFFFFFGLHLQKAE